MEIVNGYEVYWKPEQVWEKLFNSTDERKMVLAKNAYNTMIKAYINDYRGCIDIQLEFDEKNHVEFDDWIGIRFGDPSNKEECEKVVRKAYKILFGYGGKQ